MPCGVVKIYEWSGELTLRSCLMRQINFFLSLIFSGWHCRTKKELNSLSPIVGLFGIVETR